MRKIIPISNSYRVWLCDRRDEEEQVYYLEESVELLEQIEAAAEFWCGAAEEELPQGSSTRHPTELSRATVGGCA
jgi:hypothetical protein